MRTRIIEGSLQRDGHAISSAWGEAGYHAVSRTGPDYIRPMAQLRGPIADGAARVRTGRRSRWSAADGLSRPRPTAQLDGRGRARRAAGSPARASRRAIASRSWRTTTRSWIAGYLGILRIGAVAVPLDTAYKPAQVRTVLDNAGARVLFTTPKYATAAPVPIGLRRCHGVVVHVARSPRPRGTRRLSIAANRGPRDRRRGRHPLHVRHDRRSQGRRADARQPRRRARGGVRASSRSTKHDAVLGVLPLFHALAQMANLLLPLSVGARVVFLETVSSSSLLEALHVARHHDLRVRAAVLLSDPPARDVRRSARKRRAGARVFRAHHRGQRLAARSPG